jgi:hypothetical protein
MTTDIAPDAATPTLDGIQRYSPASNGKMVDATDGRFMFVNQHLAIVAAADVQIDAVRHRAELAEAERNALQAQIDKREKYATPSEAMVWERDQWRMRAEAAEHDITRLHDSLTAEVNARLEAERQLAAANEKVRELSEDAARYHAFRAAVSNGNFQGKEKQPWREAFEFWFSKFQPEDSLDAAIDNAIAGKNTFPTAKQAKAALEASLERICPTARKEKP